MEPKIFIILKDDPVVTALLGTNPLKVFPFDEAPPGSPYPYVTYTVFSGIPENTMDKPPLTDKLGTQVDIWAKTRESCLDVAAAVRDALEPHAHMIASGNMIRDPDTKAYRVRLDFDFYTER